MKRICPECGAEAIELKLDDPGNPMDGMRRVVCQSCDWIVGDYSEECEKCNVVVSADDAKLADFWKKLEYHKVFECARVTKV